jgi:hypothetical protein
MRSGSGLPRFPDRWPLKLLPTGEPGTAAVDRIVNAADNVVRVSRLTVTELTSAFAIKVRTQSIDRKDAELFLRQFRRDVATGKLEVFSIGESDFALADSLVERYAFDSRLRTLDALQLEVALELNWWIILFAQMGYSAMWPD